MLCLAKEIMEDTTTIENNYALRMNKLFSLLIMSFLKGCHSFHFMSLSAKLITLKKQVVYTVGELRHCL